MGGESVILLLIYLGLTTMFVRLMIFKDSNWLSRIIHGVGALLFLVLAITTVVVSIFAPKLKMGEIYVSPPSEEERLPPGADARLLEVGCGVTFNVGPCLNVTASSASPADVIEWLAPEWYGDYCRLDWQYSTEPVGFSAENVAPNDLLQFLRTF